MYKIATTSMMNVKRVPYAVNYTSPIPTNFTASLLNGSYYPVAWQDLTFRITDGTQTYTEVLSELCNPAIPSSVQGTPELMQDGTYSCPAIYPCLNSVCEDNNLTPDGEGFPDLRTCVCSYTEVIHPYYDALPRPSLDTFYTSQISAGALNFAANETGAIFTVGTIYCNDAALRTCDVMLSLQNPTYIAQCINLRVNYFDNIPSRYFGLFWKANPRYQYDIAREYWTETHYAGIASILNNKMYVRAGQYVNPFTKKLWRDYYWFNSSVGFNIVEQEITFEEDNSTYQSYYFQGEPFITLMNSEPGIAIDYTLSRSATEQQKLCITFAHIIGDFTECAGLTWNVTATPGFHLAGYENTFQITAEQYVVSIGISITESDSNIKGIEVYNVHGDLCGGIYINGTTVGDTYAVSCYDVNSSQVLRAGDMAIRLLGLASIYDVPEQNLNSADLPTVSDPLAALIDELEFTAYKDGSLPMCFASIYDRLPGRNWPQRRFYNFDYDPFTKFTVSMNYTATTTTSIDIINAFQNITEAIYENNTYPFNYALEEIETEYTLEDYNSTSQKQLDFLYDFWRSQLAPRLVGADDTQCETFGRGKSIILPDIVQYWYNGDINPGYEIPAGSEGGCRCYSKFNRGFYNPRLNCQQCTPGYGPNTMDDFFDTLQYNQLVAQVIDPDTFPTSFSLSYFRENIACRFPYGKDPIVSTLKDINLCAGHGVMTYSQNTTLETITVWDRFLVAACTNISTPERVYTLFGDITSVYAQIFIDDDDNILSMVGTRVSYEVYLNGVLCSTQCPTNLLIPEPWTCQFTCDEEVVYYTCMNPTIFTTTANNLTIAYTPNPFILYLPTD